LPSNLVNFGNVMVKVNEDFQHVVNQRPSFSGQEETASASGSAVLRRRTNDGPALRLLRTNPPSLLLLTKQMVPPLLLKRSTRLRCGDTVREKTMLGMTTTTIFSTPSPTAMSKRTTISSV
jgi:hypothetical protein